MWNPDPCDPQQHQYTNVEGRDGVAKAAPSQTTLGLLAIQPPLLPSPTLDTSTVRLRAVSGTPLDELIVRDMVVSAAEALAEREGVTITDIHTTTDSVTLTLSVDRLAALGFLAELRRHTNAWYEGKYRDGPLWGTPPPGKEDWGNEDWQ